MATIQYNDYAPSAYSDIGSGGVQSGPDVWDDLQPTVVTVTAQVTNTGNADGAAKMDMIDLDQWEYDIVPIATSGGWTTIRAGAGLEPWEGGSGPAVTLRLTYKVPNGRKMSLGVDVLNQAGGEPLATKSFTVNSYEIPKRASLSSEAIQISVT